jgi:hypothetical protein
MKREKNAHKAQKTRKLDAKERQNLDAVLAPGGEVRECVKKRALSAQIAGESEYGPVLLDLKRKSTSNQSAQIGNRGPQRPRTLRCARAHKDLHGSLASRAQAQAKSRTAQTASWEMGRGAESAPQNPSPESRDSAEFTTRFLQRGGD